MPADTLIYGLGEPKAPFQSRNEPLINKVKTSGWLNNVWIISFGGDEKKKIKTTGADIESDTIRIKASIFCRKQSLLGDQRGCRTTTQNSAATSGKQMK